MVAIAIMGASGYVGGELLRLLLSHPDVNSVQAASDLHAGAPIGDVHPNLRGESDLHFVNRAAIQPCDVLFLCMPHGSAAADLAAWQGIAEITIDLSADFRLKDTKIFEQYYGHPHLAPEMLQKFVLGIPEFERQALTSANYIAGPGCSALAASLAIRPLSQAGVITDQVFVDSKVGSSGAGSTAVPSSHHPLRAGGVRVFKATGHRHEAEVSAICNLHAYLTVSSIDAVRGVLVAAYCELSYPVEDNDLRAIYRAMYGREAFVRLVKRKREGPYALPEPKLLTGTNYCDVGFAQTRDGRCVVAFAALDNLTKGAAGNAVHCMNIRLGLNERVGLNFISTHPA
ncbi:N-acetyl-gamma-glutamyl-phosphate reductase [Consotaella aegiceratis]|uniref:N-acetyl-gamma-glutamyl-phosphate reductase n=1 Tax=Consotaella aegiceratis TaxID=3097961 RepID=UPI002F42BB8B